MDEARRTKVVLEMRAALDGHAGIPQETRLLFRGLQRIDGVDVEGLIQSSNRVLSSGLPAAGSGWSEDRKINRFSRVIISLQHGAKLGRATRVVAGVSVLVSTSAMVIGTLLGRRLPLGRFEAARFKDFVWQAMFSKTLKSTDFDHVTSAGFRVARVPWVAVHLSALALRRLGYALYPRLDTRCIDVMIVETPYPGRVSRPTRLVVRYHDAIPLLMPHTISNKAFHQASHYHALRRNVADGAWFACVSDATRQDLVSVFPESAGRAVTIHNMISDHYHADESSGECVPEIVVTRRNHSVKLGGEPLAANPVRRGDVKFQYLLMVSTIEPRKNHLTLLAAWELLRNEGFHDLQLVFVGGLGWDHRSIIKKFRPWLTRGGLHLLEDVPADELRRLYRHASATICPSYGEGFDFSGVEAMRCGGLVAASDIPVHRDIFGTAAEYFSAYSASDAARAIVNIISPGAESRRQELRLLGQDISSRYTSERILPQWRDFLQRLQTMA